jgi:hypothetical protein
MCRRSWRSRPTTLKVGSRTISGARPARGFLAHVGTLDRQGAHEGRLPGNDDAERPERAAKTRTQGSCAVCADWPAFCFLWERRRMWISSSVRSGSAAINSISHCLCCSNGERLCRAWPRRFRFSSSEPSIGSVVEAPRSRMRAASRAISPDRQTQPHAPSGPSSIHSSSHAPACCRWRHRI